MLVTKGQPQEWWPPSPSLQQGCQSLMPEGGWLWGLLHVYPQCGIHLLRATPPEPLMVLYLLEPHPTPVLRDVAPLV